MAAGKINLLYNPPQPQPKKKTTKLSKAQKKEIEKMIDGKAETYQAYTTSGDSLVSFNSGINAAGDMVQIMPSISKGDDENQRSGEQITAKSLTVKGYMKLTINEIKDGTTLPHVMARLMVVSLKNRSNYADATGGFSFLSSLLQKGGTTTAFTGVLSDLYAPINSEVFTSHYDKKFYLNQNYVNVDGASPPTTVLPQDVKNTVKFFKIKVKCKNKVLKYDSAVGSGLTPSNFAPMLLLGYVYLTGASPDTISTNVQLHYISTLNFKDI